MMALLLKQLLQVVGGVLCLLLGCILLWLVWQLNSTGLRLPPVRWLAEMHGRLIWLPRHLFLFIKGGLLALLFSIAWVVERVGEPQNKTPKIVSQTPQAKTTDTKPKPISQTPQAGTADTTPKTIMPTSQVGTADTKPKPVMPTPQVGTADTKPKPVMPTSQVGTAGTSPEAVAVKPHMQVASHTATVPPKRKRIRFALRGDPKQQAQRLFWLTAALLLGLLALYLLFYPPRHAQQENA